MINFKKIAERIRKSNENHDEHGRFTDTTYPRTGKASEGEYSHPELEAKILAHVKANGPTTDHELMRHTGRNITHVSQAAYSLTMQGKLSQRLDNKLNKFEYHMPNMKKSNFKKLAQRIRKSNDNHDELGRFASGPNGSGSGHPINSQASKAELAGFKADHRAAEKQANLVDRETLKLETQIKNASDPKKLEELRAAHTAASARSLEAANKLQAAAGKVLEHPQGRADTLARLRREGKHSTAANMIRIWSGKSLGKSNENHDAQGRFSASGGGAGKYHPIAPVPPPSIKNASGVKRDGSKYHFLDAKGKKLATAQSLREAHTMAHGEKLDIHGELSDLSHGQSHYYKFNANHGEGGRFAAGEGGGNHPKILGLNDRMQANAKTANEMLHHSYQVGAALRSGDRRKADFHRGEIKRLQGEMRSRSANQRASHRGSNYVPMGHHIGH